MTVADALKLYHDSLLSIYDASESRSIARLVFEKVLALNQLQMGMDRYRLLTTYQQETIKNVLAELLAHKPVQYVLGEAEFYGLTFKVNESVLIPRPETEDLVRLIIERVGKESAKSILDIGTGSGCIAVSLAKELPSATISACDIDDIALAVAAANAKANKVAVEFYNLDILNAAPGSTYDIIVSNPPYINNEEKKDISRHVLEFEPHKALFVDGTDELLFYKRIAELGKHYLNPNGMLFLEIHSAKGKETVDIFINSGYKVELLKDFVGNDRMVYATLHTAG